MPSLSFQRILNHSVKVSRRVEGSVDSYGQPAVGFTTVTAALSVYLWSLRGSKDRRDAGEEQIGEFRLMAMPTANLMAKDVLEPLVGIVGFTRAEVLWAKGIMDLDGGTHHLEADVRSF